MEMSIDTEIRSIAKQFLVTGEVSQIKECKSGHINSTYFVTFGSCSGGDDGRGGKYVLQKINTYVFKNPDHLMSNIVGVTNYLRGIIESEGGDVERGTLRFIPCRDGKYYYRAEDGGCYRMYVFIDDVISYQLADSTELFEKAGYAFGDFQNKLAGYDATTLYETIPDFHNTKNRYERFDAVASACSSGREATAAGDIAFIRERKDKCAFIVDAIADREIPVRVTHNDTKLNNILMDKTTGEGICIIDLDTVMPGSVLYDFGDAIRFGASSAVEDETDLDKVFFRTDMFEAFARGYIRGAGGKLTESEIRNLPMGAYIITLESGMRFLTDFLENDVYFRTEYSDHNLIRARNQLKLVYDIETRMNEFNCIINKLI